MSREDDIKEIEEQNKIRESELIAKYGVDITKLRKRAYSKKSKENKK